MAENSTDPNSLVEFLKGLCSCMDNLKKQKQKTKQTKELVI